jgi:O-antigen/teichoic acid export membrane protein
VTDGTDDPLAAPAPSIARDTAWSFVAEAVRVLAGVGVFLLVARGLGKVEFGVFSAIAALVTMMTPFANLGAPLLLVQRVRRDDHAVDTSFRVAWTMLLAGSAGGVLVALLVVPLILGHAPIVAVLAIAVGEFALAGATSLCSYLAIACGDMRTHALIDVAASLLRLGAAALLLAIGAPTVTSWGITQAVALAVTAVGAIRLSQMKFGVHARLAPVRRIDIVGGLPYSASIAAFSAQDGIDKPLLVRYGWKDDAGLYTAAYRVSALAFLPVQSLVLATFNRSFSEGKRGIAASLKLARKLLIPSLAYASVAAAAIIAFAPLARPILGDDFEASLPMIRWLAFLPVIRTLQYFPANALTGAGYQRARLVVLVITLTINATLCLTLIPSHSWRGAIIATVAAEVAYCLMLWAFALSRVRHEARVAAPAH